ncbi:MAG TPA: carotenoid biosynthesis protein [Deltaproteobacteria bacterium]|nr:carotenoid biosynthesis protein [Deltaproteobacteria bacterium]
MADLFSKITGTILLRPYVFIFLLIYLLAAFSQIGWKKTSLFLLIGYLTAFFSEYSSIHTGIPYGLYHYIPTTQAKELWIAGVPFMDSLSYVFLAYCSFATALFLFSPLYAFRRELFILDTPSIRSSFRVLALSAFLMTFLDIVIDPVALQGSRWFLGQIYYYPSGGVYFGVPLSNFTGWFIAGGLMIYFLQKIDKRQVREDHIDKFFYKLPWGSFLGVFLYIGILFFNISISYMIKEFPLAIVNTFYGLLFLALCFCSALYKLEKVFPADLQEHIEKYPNGRLAMLMGNKTFMEVSDGSKDLHQDRGQGQDRSV